MSLRHHYDKKTGELVLDLLREHVHSRGLELPEKNKKLGWFRV